MFPEESNCSSDSIRAITWVDNAQTFTRSSLEIAPWKNVHFLISSLFMKNKAHLSLHANVANNIDA